VSGPRGKPNVGNITTPRPSRSSRSAGGGATSVPMPTRRRNGCWSPRMAAAPTGHDSGRGRPSWLASPRRPGWTSPWPTYPQAGSWRARCRARLAERVFDRCEFTASGGRQWSAVGVQTLWPRRLRRPGRALPKAM